MTVKTTLIVTRRYVQPEEILSIDSTLGARLGTCLLWIRSPVCEHGWSVAADLADVAPLLAW